MTEMTLAKRMKEFYEGRNQTYLTRRTPVILRLDGKAFHTFTKNKILNFKRPFDGTLGDWMVETTKVLCQEVQGCKLGYTQSDEISLLITDYDNLNSEAWFNYKVQKMVSVAASIASATFAKLMFKDYLMFRDYEDKDLSMANFDCRAFNIPINEVNNYFIWRQQDWTRNSIQMLAKEHFSHKELQGKGKSDMHEMLHQKGINWADLDTQWKNGTMVIKSSKSITTPNGEKSWRTYWRASSFAIFSKSPEHVNELIKEKD